MKKIMLGTCLFMCVMACTNENLDAEISDNGAETLFNVVLSTSTEGNTETYVQALENLKDGEISFHNYGFEVPSTRTARVFASQDGKTLYNLNYGGGTIMKFTVAGGQNYYQTNETNVALMVGTEYPRWTVLNDKNALVHNVTTKNKFTDEDNQTSGYLYTEATATIVDVDLSDMSLGSCASFLIPTSEKDRENNQFIFRIDAPAIADGKAYYGVAKRKLNPNNPDEQIKNISYPATTLVVDYPSLENPKVIESAVANGSTYGYRIPVSHQDEHGNVYQITASHLLKLNDGQYDDNYVFNLSEAAASEVSALGWFYAGNGIGYATYYDTEKGNSEEAAAWGILRIDIYNKTAIRMNVPSGLYLNQYQYAKVLNGKVYMALCPVGREGNVYIFDASKADADGFEIGAKLKTGAGASYIGIF
ncbi:MAG: hypothetical protein IKU85_10495 [Bacteroidaceae bacterium]|nr:hypothetical protein [Bacteroidaceae bacterium]